MLLHRTGRSSDTLPKGRDIDIDDVQTVVQIGTETAVLHGAGEILIGGGDDTGLEGDLLVAAQGNVFLGFQDTEQLDLHVHRHGAEFVQKERALAGQFEFADLAVLCARR